MFLLSYFAMALNKNDNTHPERKHSVRARSKQIETTFPKTVPGGPTATC